MTEKHSIPADRPVVGYPLPIYRIEDLETLRAFAEPMRMQIYDTVIKQAATVRQIADRLGLAPSRLYYHINRLEELGLLRVVDTRQVANLIEKAYRAVAYEIDIAPQLLDFRKEETSTSLRQMLLAPIESTRMDLERSLTARQAALAAGSPEKSRPVIVNRSLAKITTAQAETLVDHLQALIREFASLDQNGMEDDTAEQDEFALTVALYPVFYFEEPNA